MKVYAILFIITVAFQVNAQENVAVKVGDSAIDFVASTLNGEEIQLSEINKNGPVVFIVLRGWPEYQCPICTRQVGRYIASADDFKKYNSNVVMIYPAPIEVTKDKATEFSSGFSFPDNFYFATDPGFTVVNKYGLRWNAPRETAYPSTFVINKNGKIVWLKVSSTHGGRAKVDEVLEVLKGL